MNCPKCNAVLSDNSKFCKNCGAKIEKPVESAPETQSTAVCIKCGAPLKQGAKFCAKCGAAQNVQPAQAEPQPVEPAPQPAQSAEQAAPQPVQSVAQPVPQLAQSAPQPAQAVAQPMPQPAQPAAQQKPKKKSKMPIVLIILFVLILVFVVGGSFVLVKVFDVDPIAMITGSEDEDEDESQDGDEEDVDPAQEQKDKEKGDPELLDALDTQVEALSGMSQQEVIDQSIALIHQYVAIGEENNLTEEAGEKIEYVFEMASKATIESCKGIESQQYGSAGYEQVTSMVNVILEEEAFLKEKGYVVDSSEITEFSNGIIQRFKDAFIKQINEITEREQWSRDEAWTYAEQAYSIQKNGKILLFDEDDLDDPLRLRYAYCLAWITRKRCENGVADGSMTNEDAFNAAVAILQETDYNLLVLQDAISYGNAAGKDISSYQSAYNAIIQKLKDEQNLSIVNSGVNSATSVDIRKFWYFNDLSGDDAYKVDINNGTTQATRDWIRDNIPSYINN